MIWISHEPNHGGWVWPTNMGHTQIVERSKGASANQLIKIVFSIYSTTRLEQLFLGFACKLIETKKILLICLFPVIS